MTNSQILDSINQNIKQNGKEEITGVVLNSILRMLLDFVNKGFISISDVIQLLADSKTVNVLGSINPITNTTDLPNGVYHAQTSGTYNNAGGIEVKEGYYTLLRKLDDGSWVLESEVEMPKVEVDQNFDENSENAIANKAVTPLSIVLDSFIKPEEGIKRITDFVRYTYLKQDGSTATSDGNKSILNVDVTGYNTLIYNCYPAIIKDSLKDEYCAILGKLPNGSYEVVRKSTILDEVSYNQQRVEEKFDISKYSSISISIGDLFVSINQEFDVSLINSDIYKPGFERDSVKDYIDESVNKFSAKIELNKIKEFSTSNSQAFGNIIFDNGIAKIDGAGSFNTHERTLNENSEISYIYKEETPSVTLIGFESKCDLGVLHHFYCKYNTHGVNFGKLEILAKSGLSYSKLSTDFNSNYSIGDMLKVTIKRKELLYNVKVQNLTKGWVLKQNVEASPIGVPFAAHNTSSPGVRNDAGKISVYEYNHIGFSRDIDYCIVGDSITYGQSASSYKDRWAQLINGNNLVMGGGADYTALVLSRVTEIIKINPKKVLLMIGGNDILFGVNTSVWQQNLRDIRNQLSNANIEVVHCYPTPRAGATQLINFIKSEFIYDLKIDTNTPLNTGSYENIKSEYDSGDNLHPNSLGMKKISDIVNGVL